MSVVQSWRPEHEAFLFEQNLVPGVYVISAMNTRDPVRRVPTKRTANPTAIVRVGGVVFSLLVFSCMAAHRMWGQNLQPTAPTGAAAATPNVVSGPGNASAPEGPERHRAEVQFHSGMLQVQAENSSLNQILRAISQQTGMTITGGVTDQRVFGSYGPGPAAQVISDLLEDTGVNMLLKMTPQGSPAELILSQRMGGPTPPSPSTAREDPADAQASVVGNPSSPTQVNNRGQATATPQSQVPPLPFSQPAAQPPATDPFVTPQTPPPGGIVEPPTVAPATEPGTTPGPSTQTTGTSPSADSGGDTSANPASPNGVKTPQEIYQELQKLLQQQNQQNQQNQQPSTEQQK